MPIFRVKVKASKNMDGIRIERGMSVDVVTSSANSPIDTMNGVNVVHNAFLRIYGIDIKRAGVLSPTYLDVERIGLI